MTTSIAKRIAALAVIVVGLLLLVLAPAGDATSSYRIVGLLVAAAGGAWLGAQRRDTSGVTDEPYQQPVLRWYQAPIVLFPIILLIVASLVYLAM